MELAAVRTLTRDPGALPDAEPVDELPALPFVFSEFDASGAADVDELDDAVVAAVEPHREAVSGIWRSWRYLDLDLLIAGAGEGEQGEAVGVQQTAGGDGGQAVAAGDSQEDAAVLDVAAGEDDVDEGGWGPLTPITRAIDAMPDPFRPYRVYLVEVEDPALIQRLAGDLLSVASDSANAGVEIVQVDAELPPYQRAALSGALLLWAASEPEFTMARVFDFADPVTGPGFEPGHLVIDDPAERAGLLEYLQAGSLC